MNASKMVLLAIGVFTVMFGLSFVFAPHYFFALYTDGAFTTTSAAMDVRTTYGGFSLGIGLFFLWGSKNNIRAGLMAALLALSCITAARILGLVLDGSPNTTMWVFFAMEIVSLIAVFLVWRKASA